MPGDTFLDRPIDRRTLIKGGLAFVGASAAIPPAYLRAAFDENSSPIASAADLAAPGRRRVLVVLQLAGGNDGLNTVVPLADRAYFVARPAIAVNPESTLPLEHGMALNGALTGLKSLWDQKRLAVVLGVGYPNPNRSHFAAMDIWHTATIAESTGGTGWIGRLLDATARDDDSAWRAANVGSELPRSLASDATFVPSLSSIPAYVLATDRRFPQDAQRRAELFRRIHATYAQDAAVQAEYGGALAFVSRTGLEAYDSTIALRAEATSYTPRATYPTTPLGQAFQTAATLIMSRLGTGVLYLTTGGFDTHAGQNATQTRLLQGVSDAIAAFYADLAAQGVADDVATVAWTEFGRRVKENGSGGTDHGTATPMFVVGGGVTPGLFGEQPSAASTDSNGDLQFTTDFRAVYASIIEQRFGVDAAEILGQRFGTLPLFA